MNPTYDYNQPQPNQQSSYPQPPFPPNGRITRPPFQESRPDYGGPSQPFPPSGSGYGPRANQYTGSPAGGMMNAAGSSTPPTQAYGQQAYGNQNGFIPPPPNLPSAAGLNGGFRPPVKQGSDPRLANRPPNPGYGTQAAPPFRPPPVQANPSFTPPPSLPNVRPNPINPLPKNLTPTIPNFPPSVMNTTAVGSPIPTTINEPDLSVIGKEESSAVRGIKERPLFCVVCASNNVRLTPTSDACRSDKTNHLLIETHRTDRWKLTKS
jgi:hypothetical protein